MAGPYLVNLPVHTGGLAVVDLDAVHADITLTGIWILGIDGRKRDEASSVLGPALEDRKLIQRKWRPLTPLPHAIDDFLTRRAFYCPRAGMDQVDPVAKEFHGILEALRRLRLHQELEL